MANFRYAAYRAGLETLYFSGVHHVLRTVFGGIGAIFTLHHVRPARNGAFQPNRMLEIEPGFLDRVIVHLRSSGVEIISMDEVHRRLSERDFSRHFVAFTLDDGYRDNLEHAWPILQRHQVPCTLYIATSFPDRLGELWWLALERVIAKTNRLVLEIDGVSRFINCVDSASKSKAFAEIYWWLHGLEDEGQLRRIMRDLCARYGVDLKEPCRDLCMNWSEIATLAEDPLVSIGAHSVNHMILRKWPVDVARAEMKRSAEVIEASLDRRLEHFAYPYGDSSAAGPREFALAAELGFKTAVTTRAGVLFPEHREHLTALPRISLNGQFQAVRYVDVLLSGVPLALVNGFRRVDAA